MITQQPFYFLRHGQTEHNVKQLLRGHQDISLNHYGKQQALSAQPLLEQCNIATVCYSPLTRTYETMSLATANLSCNKIALYDLQAIDTRMETEQEFCKRVRTGINHALDYPALVLIVSHGDVYKRLCHLLDLAYFPIDNGQIVHFKPRNGAWEMKKP